MKALRFDCGFRVVIAHRGWALDLRLPLPLDSSTWRYWLARKPGARILGVVGIRLTKTDPYAPWAAKC